ncbi:MAG: PRC-barrel domain-containing protein [Parafilimonas terrae]|nr:PRC-barrel domain-containing protein [Parafilimonas terrae]
MSTRDIGLDANSRAATADTLIASDKVEGTAVRRGDGVEIGTIQRLMIDKPSGRIAYAIMRLIPGADQAKHERAIPWGALSYDVAAKAYVIEGTEDTIRSSPVYPQTTSDPTFDPAWEEHVHRYFNSPPYWNSEADRATDVSVGHKKE